MDVVGTYTPSKELAGEGWVTVSGTLLSGQNLEELTVLAQDSAGKYYAHPGNTSGFVAAASAGSPTVAADTTLPVAGILRYATNASTGTVNNAGNTVDAGVAADTACSVIVDGHFFGDELVYKLNGNGSAAGADMANTSTTALKAKLFAGSSLHVSFQQVGEV